MPHPRQPNPRQPNPAQPRPVQPRPANRQASPFTETALRQALGDCFIPGQHRDIVTAGLLQSASVFPDLEAPGRGIPGVPDRFLARVTLLEPSKDEAVNAQMRFIVENRLLGLPAISRVEVTLVRPLFSILP